MPTKKKSAVEVFEQEEKAAEAAAPTTEKRTRTFRSVEERMAEVDQKIAFHQKALDQLEAKKSKIGTAHRTRKLTYAKVFAELKSSGKTPEEIAALLKT